MENFKLELVVAALINFGILFFMFKYFLADKLSTAIEERRKHLEASSQAESLAKEKLQEAESQAEELIDAARSKAQDIENTASEIAKSNSQKEIEKAEKEAVHILTSANEQIEKEKLDMHTTMRSQIINVALKLNEKIFGKSSANKEFMEKEYEALVK